MTRIEWTDETWNPITGCTPISAGCVHCYAKRMATRLRGRFGYPEKGNFPFRPGVEHPDQWAKPESWKKPRKIFVCSMGDLFHEAVTDQQIERVLSICRSTPRHIFQILTKRPGRAMHYMDYPENVWLGTTVEDHSQYGRIVDLSLCSASTIFLSCEPLLSPLNTLGAHLKSCYVNWVIVGPETGPNARPMEKVWATSIRDQCASASVPFFFKGGTLDGVEYHNFPKGE